MYQTSWAEFNTMLDYMKRDEYEDLIFYEGNGVRYVTHRDPEVSRPVEAPYSRKITKRSDLNAYFKAFSRGIMSVDEKRDLPYNDPFHSQFTVVGGETLAKAYNFMADYIFKRLDKKGVHLHHKRYVDLSE